MSLININEVLERCMTVAGVRKQQDLAKHLHATDKTISAWKRRNSVPIERLTAFAVTHDASLDWLLLGKTGELLPTDMDSFAKQIVASLKIPQVREAVNGVLNSGAAA